MEKDGGRKEDTNAEDVDDKDYSPEIKADFDRVRARLKKRPLAVRCLNKKEVEKYTKDPNWTLEQGTLLLTGVRPLPTPEECQDLVKMCVMIADCYCKMLRGIESGELETVEQ
jgi:hypothetical protein